MEKRFRFTNDKLRALPPNPPDAHGADLGAPDTVTLTQLLATALGRCQRQLFTHNFCTST